MNKILIFIEYFRSIEYVSLIYKHVHVFWDQKQMIIVVDVAWATAASK